MFPRPSFSLSPLGDMNAFVFWILQGFHLYSTYTVERDLENLVSLQLCLPLATRVLDEEAVKE